MNNIFDIGKNRRFMFPRIHEADSAVWLEAVAAHTKPYHARRWARESQPRPVTVDYRSHRRWALEHGRQIHAATSQSGRTATNHTRHATVRLHMMGACAEAAVCLYLGLDPCEHMLINRDGTPDDGYDIRTPAGHTIDVKATERARRSFLVNTIHDGEMRADFGVCVWMTGKGTAQIAGWISRADYYRRRYFDESMPKACYVVRWERLRQMRRDSIPV